MKNKNQKLLLHQTVKKINQLEALNQIPAPPNGWVNLIRLSLKMSLRQLGNRLGISAQSIKELEQRETNGTVTLNTLKEAADALGMKLVYGFVPKDRSLEEMIERKAYELAEEIVQRTSHTMKLEEQEVSYQRRQKAIQEKAEEIKNSMPRNLWD
jgi:predicted DNA-binding mobile mystery protein A